jgi:ribose-phosphate pyrophosphokinase
MNKQLEFRMRRINLVLSWILSLEDGDNMTFEPLLPHEESIDILELLKVCNAVNALHGGRAIAHTNGCSVQYLGEQHETKEKCLTESEKEAVQRLFSEERQGVEGNAQPCLEDKTGANSLATSISDYETATHAAQFTKPVIKSSLAFRFNDNGVLMVPQVSLFSGGEVNLNTALSPVDVWDVTYVSVYARLQCANGIVALLMLKDALERTLGAFNEVKYILFLDYVPYARQDRPCNEGEALSIKVMADLINTMSFDKVQITDPHSDVTPALINYSDTAHCTDIIASFPELLEAIDGGAFDALVAPDGGAIKKVEAVAKLLGLPVIYGHKKRDTGTGALSGFGYQGDVKDMNLLIVDDICDGGGTFIGLGEALRTGGAIEISLYVTHGIFSKGVDNLLNMFDKVYTTDSFVSGYEHARLVVKKIYGT